MADSITTIIAKAIHKGRSDIPWEASASQDTAYRDARSAMSAMPHPSERHAAEVGEDADAIERLHRERNRFRGALLQIKYAAEDGRICDDVAWFSQHETLFDYIEGTLETAQAAVGELFQGALRDCPFCGGKAVRRDDPGVPDVPFGLVVDHQPGCFLGLRRIETDAAIDATWNTRALPAPAPVAGVAVAEEFTALEAWQELVNYDDRTSPEEHPDMALITFEELRMFMSRAAFPDCSCGEVAGEDPDCTVHSSAAQSAATAGCAGAWRYDLASAPEEVELLVYRHDKPSPWSYGYRAVAMKQDNLWFGDLGDEITLPAAWTRIADIPCAPSALDLVAAGKGVAECASSPNGLHQVDTSMESGPNNCFHCEAPMGRPTRGEG